MLADELTEGINERMRNGRPTVSVQRTTAGTAVCMFFSHSLECYSVDS